MFDNDVLDPWMSEVSVYLNTEDITYLSINGENETYSILPSATWNGQWVCNETETTGTLFQVLYSIAETEKNRQDEEDALEQAMDELRSELDNVRYITDNLLDNAETGEWDTERVKNVARRVAQICGQLEDARYG